MRLKDANTKWAERSWYTDHFTGVMGTFTTPELHAARDAQLRSEQYGDDWYEYPRPGPYERHCGDLMENAVIGGSWVAPSDEALDFMPIMCVPMGSP